MSCYSRINLWFSPDRDEMISNIDLNAERWQSHTTEVLTNIVYEGDHFSWYEDSKNEMVLKEFKGTIEFQ